MPARKRRSARHERLAERRKSNISRDRWLVSYADFITLLFAFFVVLYAFAKADQKKQMQVTAVHRRGLPLSGHLSRRRASAGSTASDRQRHRAAGHPHEHRDGRGCAVARQGQGRPGPHSPRTGADALQPGRHAHRLHPDGPRRAGHQPARGRLLQLRLGHSQARNAAHAAPDRQLRWAALPTTCASRATPTTFPSTPRNSTPTGSSPRPAPRASPASSST